MQTSVLCGERNTAVFLAGQTDRTIPSVRTMISSLPSVIARYRGTASSLARDSEYCEEVGRSPVNERIKSINRATGDICSRLLDSMKSETGLKADGVISMALFFHSEGVDRLCCVRGQRWQVSRRRPVTAGAVTIIFTTKRKVFPLFNKTQFKL